jgi:hypothetical protein
MTSHSDLPIAVYVKSTAALLNLPLSEAQTARVAMHLQRTASMASLIQAVELPLHEELAEIYCPAAFPANKYARKEL